MSRCWRSVSCLADLVHVHCNIRLMCISPISLCSRDSWDVCSQECIIYSLYPQCLWQSIQSLLPSTKQGHEKTHAISAYSWGFLAKFSAVSPGPSEGHITCEHTYVPLQIPKAPQDMRKEKWCTQEVWNPPSDTSISLKDCCYQFQSYMPKTTRKIKWPTTVILFLPDV